MPAFVNYYHCTVTEYCHNKKELQGASLPRHQIVVSRYGVIALRSGYYRERMMNPDYALRRLRPLARRALIILRPALVLMRARKPWVLLRRKLLG
jgi:hypothetical protein